MANPLQPALSIGAITFLDNEHPSELKFPLAQQVAEHLLPGGGKIMQTFGAQPKDVTWKGTFWDSTAKQRSDALKSLNAAGQAVPLTFGDESYSVIIKSYDPTTIHQWRIDYKITVGVLADLSGKYTQPAQSSIDTQTQALYQNLTPLTNAIVNLDPSVYSNISIKPTQPSNLQSLVNTLGNALQQAGALAQASTSQVNAITSAANALAVALQSYQSQINNVIATYTSVIPSNIQQSYANVTNALALVGLISANAQAGQAPKTVQISGPITLFEVASKYYGDPTLAPVLKSANKIVGMQIPAGVTLNVKLPPAQPHAIQ